MTEWNDTPDLSLNLKVQVIISEYWVQEDEDHTFTYTFWLGGESLPDIVMQALDSAELELIHELTQPVGDVVRTADEIVLITEGGLV